MNESGPRICAEFPLPSGSAIPATAVLVVSNGCDVDREAVEASHLSPAEIATLRPMRAVPSRETEWLLGRCAAKAAVRIYLQRSSGIRIAAHEVVIEVDERGKPRVAGLWAAQVSEGVSVSISHSRGVAVAVAWGGGDGPAGIDLEFPRALSDALIARSFSEDEISRAGGRDHALELWCLKEAAAKATGDGILKSLREVNVISSSELASSDTRFSTLLLPFRGGFIAIACVAR